MTQLAQSDSQLKSFLIDYLKQADAVVVVVGLLPHWKTMSLSLLLIPTPTPHRLQSLY